MNAETFDQAMNAFRNRTPYRPFTVVLVNGDRYEIDHPNAYIVRDGVGMYIAPGGVPIIFDHEGVNQIVGDLNTEAPRE